MALHACHGFARFAMIALLAGCASPQVGGMASQIIAGAEDPASTFSVVYVTSETLPGIARWPRLPAQVATSGWLAKDSGVSREIIEPGDSLDIQIWDNEETSLLSSPGQKVTPLPGIKVMPDGTIFLPYVDKLYVAKMSPDEARQAIQDKLLSILPSAQVLLAHASGRKNSVEVISGVPRTGVLQLPDRAMTVMDVLAESGGIQADIKNAQVRVARGSKLYSIAFETLSQHPELDSAVRPGDKIFVVPDARYFLGLGAAGNQDQFNFVSEKVSALQAVSLIGGLNANLADPKGILVLRNYPASAVSTTGAGPEKSRVVFAFDLTKADGLFSAGEFPIQDRDVVLVAQSPLISTRNILGLLSQAVTLQVNAQKL
jgi:polysaccharide biosynthesis/export protein